MLIYGPRSLSVPDMEGSTSDSTELSQMLEPSATWKTKFQPHQSWLKILKKADWMMRLFGPISRRLTLARSSEELMQSLAATLASRFPLQESEAEPMTPGTCGHTSQNSLELFGPGSVSSKTSGVTFDWDCQKCLENSDLLATELGREYSQRRKSAHRTDESEFSFSQKWPTPRAAKEEAEEAGKRRDNPMLSTVVTQQLWPTASARDYHAQGLNHNIASKSDSLATKVQRDWPTASARDYKDTPGMNPEATNPDGSRRDRTDQLARAVYWGTPRATSNGGNGKDREDNKSRLEDQVHQSFGQVALENHNTTGKNPEQSTENSIPPGSPS